MCGIVGIIAHNARVNPAILERATASLAHRGPDDAGTVVLPIHAQVPSEIGLGNRRLAILDLSPNGHQPMTDPKTGNWIVHNGEIYNHAELRTELLAEGATFSGTSDTEVLLQAYGKWGEHCLSRLRGMFAFAIWDTHRQRLFLARDQMGIKPLYWTQSGPYFAFASELRTLIGSGLIPAKLSRTGVLSFLSFGSVYEPHTMVEGVTVLPPGHYLTWEDGKLEISRYWELTLSRPAAERFDIREAVEDLEECLRQAVQMQTVSDVGVSLFLSGGIDSSALAAMLTPRSPLRTFSLIFREREFSEAEHSRTVANRFTTEHQEILISEDDACRAIPAFLQAMDQPSIDGLNTFLISEKVRLAGAKVTLSGLGGDELFAGYKTFQTVPRALQLAAALEHLPSPVKAVFGKIVGALGDSDRTRKLSMMLSDELMHPYFLSRALFTFPSTQQLLPDAEREENIFAQSLRTVLDGATDIDPISQVSYLETRCYMLNTLLRDADVMSMAHGLEVRVPLIDHKVAEKLFALPGKLRLGKFPKPLLVNATRGQLPPSIMNRRKQGFTLPFEHWLRGQLRGEVEGVLQNGERIGAAALNPKSVASVWQEFLNKRTSWARPWSLYVLSQWCENHHIAA
jgi:asparagine synthase (glutamine-hydrolysing)